MLEEIRHCLKLDKILFTKHAKDEMENEELGEIRENEVSEAVLEGKIIEDHPEDEPYASCLIYGRTSENRPLHLVCAFAIDEETAIMIAVQDE
jgi:Domain of unknown function (DUF4258)